MKRLTPDCSENIKAAVTAASSIAGLSNKILPALHAIEDNLLKCQQAGMKTEKLDYCINRAIALVHRFNEMELGSFCGISVKNTCEELWQKLP
jgi:hypothetical protein